MGKKDNSILSDVADTYLIYKLRWIIIPIVLVLAIVVGIMIHYVDKKLNDEAKANGYNSFSDDIKYDSWTGEIIPKKEINTYNNDNKYITVNEHKVYLKEIKSYLNRYEEIQGQYAFIKEKDKEEIRSICNALYKALLDIDFEIEKTDAKSNTYEIVLKDFDANGTHHDKYFIGATSDLRSILTDIFKGIYRAQNNLEPKRY